MRILKMILLIGGTAICAYPVLLGVSLGESALVGDGALLDYWLREYGRGALGRMLIRDWVSSMAVAAVIALVVVIPARKVLRRYGRIGAQWLSVGTGALAAGASAMWLGPDLWNIVLFALTGMIWMAVLLAGLYLSGSMKLETGQ